MSRQIGKPIKEEIIGYLTTCQILGSRSNGGCSTTNIEMVRSLGADRVIDYTQEDFTQSSETYDVIFDAVGKKPSSQGKKSLKKTGIYPNVLTASDVQSQHEMGWIMNKSVRL